MDGIIEGLGRGLLHLLRWLIIDIVIDIFIYSVGYGTLKVVSGGKYPTSKQDNKTLCLASGVFMLALMIAVIVFFNTK